MHVVYYVRAGANEELRYSLRSVERHVPVSRLSIIGDHPDWLNLDALEFAKGNLSPNPGPYGKYENARLNVQYAAENYPGEFVIFNDDFILLSDFEEFPLYSRYSLDSHVVQTSVQSDEGRFRKKLLSKANAFIKSKSPNPTPSSYEVHAPIPVNGTELLGMLTEYDEFWVDPVAPVMWRSIYGNFAEGREHENRSDVLAHFPSAIDAHTDLFSTADRSYANILPLLEERFPEASRWER